MDFFERIGEFFASLPAELYVFVISMLPIVELRGSIPVGAALGLRFYLNYPLSVLGNLLPVPFVLLFIPRILDFLARFKFFRPIVAWLRKKADKHSGKVLGEQSATCKVTSILLDADQENSESTPEKTAALQENGISAISGNDSASTLKNAGLEPDEAEKITNVNTAEAEMTVAGESTIDNTPRKMTRAVFVALVLFVAVPLPGTGAWTGSLVAALFNLSKKWSFLAILIGVLVSGAIMSLASYGVLSFLSFLL